MAGRQAQIYFRPILGREKCAIHSYEPGMETQSKRMVKSDWTGVPVRIQSTRLPVVFHACPSRSRFPIRFQDNSYISSSLLLHVSTRASLASLSCPVLLLDLAGNFSRSTRVQSYIYMCHLLTGLETIPFFLRKSCMLLIIDVIEFFTFYMIFTRTLSTSSPRLNSHLTSFIRTYNLQSGLEQN